MTITIPIENLNEKIKTSYLDGKIKNIGVDYEPNSIVGWLKDKEVELYNFNNVLKLDNRYCSYEIRCSLAQIKLEFS